jgi:hypothetical protein
MVRPDDSSCSRNMLCINNIGLNKCVVFDGYVIPFSVPSIAYFLAEISFEPNAPEQIHVTYEIEHCNLEK